MIKLWTGWKSFICLSVLIVCANAKADERVIYGALDDFSGNEIVVSDMAFSVSKLISCYDYKGRTLVGCGGLNRVKWVEVTVNADRVAIKVKQLTDEQYRRVSKND